PDQWYREPLPFVPNASAGHLRPAEYHGPMTSPGRRELTVMEPQGSIGALPRGGAGALDEPGPPRDALGRGLHDLRISVTDRCNFRCVYCMPKEVFGKDFAFLPKDQVLTFEEIERAARIFVGLGVEKLRITGGEPLIRRDLPALVRALAAIRRPDGGKTDL